MKASEIIEKMFEIRAERQAIAKRDKELVEEWESFELAALNHLDEQGSLSVSSALGAATITESVVPMTEDWDAVEEYIYENKALHLLQRRVATGAFRELHQAGECPPGLKPLTKRSISLTAKPK